MTVLVFLLCPTKYFTKYYYSSWKLTEDTVRCHLGLLSNRLRIILFVFSTWTWTDLQWLCCPSSWVRGSSPYILGGKPIDHLWRIPHPIQHGAQPARHSTACSLLIFLFESIYSLLKHCNAELEGMSWVQCAAIIMISPQHISPQGITLKITRNIFKCWNIFWVLNNF